MDDPQSWNMYAYVRSNPTILTDPSGLLVKCSQGLNKSDAATCQQIIETANRTDQKGNYLYPKLHEVYKRLNEDKRTFVIVNNPVLGRQVAGRFDVRQINSSRTDFAVGVINLDFSKIARMTQPSSSLITGFSKYQGLIGKPGLELSEAFGHEGEHGIYALGHLGDAVRTQTLINDQYERMQMGDRGPEFLRDSIEAAPYLNATEMDAQTTEQIINQELNSFPEE